MSKGSILIVDSDESLTNLLKIYLEARAYIVQIVSNGQDAIAEAQSEIPPDLIVLNIELPDMSGYDVCRDLRTNSETRHISIIFLTERDERSDKIFGLKLGQDDYVTKPLDFEELRLRIATQIEYSKRPRLINPTTGFPTGALIEKHLRDLLSKFATFTFIEVKILHFVEFKEIYSWQAGDEVMKTSSLMISDILEEHGSPNDFAGQLSEASFVLMSHVKDVSLLIESLKSRFDTEIQGHYSFIDRERGFMFVDDKEIPLMSLSYKLVDGASIERVEDLLGAGKE